jgi:hypothetical protein
MFDSHRAGRRSGQAATAASRSRRGSIAITDSMANRRAPRRKSQTAQPEQSVQQAGLAAAEQGRRFQGKGHFRG